MWCLGEKDFRREREGRGERNGRKEREIEGGFVWNRRATREMSRLTVFLHGGLSSERFAGLPR